MAHRPILEAAPAPTPSRPVAGPIDGRDRHAGGGAPQRRVGIACGIVAGAAAAVTLAGTIASQARAAPAAAATACTPPPRTFVERFVSARCLACWQAAPPRPAGTAGDDDGGFVLDWIVPQGTDAPLAAAAIPEAAERVALAGATLHADETLVRTEPLPARTALHVEALDGPGVHGYVGLRFAVHHTSGGALPPDLRGHLALVERLPPGSDGSPVERRVVRAVAGPLPLDALAGGTPVVHLLAVRVPDTGRPERLAAVAWIETARGRVIAVSAPREASCRPGP